MRKLRPISAVIFLAIAVNLASMRIDPQARGEFVSVPGPVHGDCRATCDLPATHHHRNVGGSDGAGLCVYTSAWHAALWQSVREVYEFRDWMKRRPGGSYPEKFTKTLEQFCAEHRIPVPAYVQCTTGDVEFLKLALRTGRMPCVTYCGSDGTYYNSVVAHMVNLVFFDDTPGVNAAAILDNNYPGKLLWMTAKEFVARWAGVREDGRAFTTGRGQRVGGGWAIVMLAPPPPPYAKPPVSSIKEDQFLASEIEPATMGDGPVLYGQCGPNGCPTRPATLSSSGGAYEWRQYASDPGKEFLFQGSRFVGVVKPNGAWHPAAPNGTHYSHEASGLPPIAPPAAPVDAGKAKANEEYGVVLDPNAENHGVDFDKLASSIPYQCYGSACKRYEAFAAVAGGGLEDDSNRFNLSVVGPKAFQDKVKADLNKPEVAKFAGRINVTYMLPDEWPVSQFSLPRGLGLRKPTEGRGRVGTDVGSVDLDLYDLMKLLELLSQMDPKPAPAPNGPNADPNAPKLPSGPVDWKWIAILILAGLTLLGKSPQAAQPAVPAAPTK